MGIEIIFIFVLLGLAFFLFSTKYVSFDVAALIILVLLAVSGILTPSETLAGFSNQATITIAAMFILSEALKNTGVLEQVGDFFTRIIQKNFKLGLLQLLLFVSVCSAFINNTAVVIIFIPIMLDISKKLDISPSKLLLPLSFAGIFGGVSTLIGTSTNILSNSIAIDRGIGNLAMFDFTPVGLILLAAGFIYLFIYGISATPARRKNDELTEGYSMHNYITDIIIEPGNKLIGELFEEEKLLKELDLNVIRIFKKDSDSSAQRSEIKLEEGDILRIRGSIDEIDKLLKREDFSIKPKKFLSDMDLEQGKDVLLEAVVAPESYLSGKSLFDIDFVKNFGSIPLAIRHQEETSREDLENIKLRGGDSILLSTSSNRLQQLNNDKSFIVVSEKRDITTTDTRTATVLGTIAAVVLLAALNIIPIVISAVIGVIFLFLTRNITPEEAYNSINWKIIVLLAGVIPLGTAMDKTGAATMMADNMIFYLSDMGPRAILSGFFLLTMLITAVMSNNASAALLVPIAIETASTLEVSPYPFIFAVTYAASLSFITPFGYQTNTLIYGTGNYKFRDFTKIGLPLNIIFWVLATIFIPMIWPF